MNTIKKIIFLVGEKKNMGTLTLEYKNSSLFGTLKTYSNSLPDELILGMKFDEKIIKQNVNLRDNVFNFKISEDVNLNSNIGCVLLQAKDNTITALLQGSNKNMEYKSNIIRALRDSINKIQTTRAINRESQKVADDQNNISSNQFPQAHSQHSNYEQLSLENDTTYTAEKYSQISLIEEDILVNSKEEIATASINPQLFESDDDEVNELIDEELRYIETGRHNFYDMIADQIDELFKRYPREKNLSTLIENSRWVKIPNETDNNFYVVGLIFNNNDIKYICYGVPGRYDVEPPMEMRNYSQWLPTDISNPYTNGYWVMYQDADTGDNIFIN